MEKLSNSQAAVLGAIARSAQKRLRLNTAQLHAIAPLVNWDQPELGLVRALDEANQGRMYELTELGRMALVLDRRRRPPDDQPENLDPDQDLDEADREDI